MKCQILLLAGVVQLGFAGAFAANDFQVPGDSDTIQGAIALASSGDRILVAPGSYSGPIDFLGKSLTLESTGGAEVTVIDGEGATGFVVTLASGEGDGSLIRGFTIAGGFGSGGSNGAGPGGGLRVVDAGLRIEASRFTGNQGLLGGGLYAQGAALELFDVRFSENAALQGAGLYAEGGQLSIDGGEFLDNEAVQFGGALAVVVANAAIADTRFENNTASMFGGALYSNHAQLQISDSLFAGNGRAEAQEHGAWIVRTGGGGAIYTSSSSGRIEASRILNNIAAFGPGVYVAGGGELEIINTLIAGNAADCNCGTGAVYANSSSPRLVNSTLADNGGFVSLFTTYNSFPVVRNSILTGTISSTAGNGLTDIAWSLVSAAPFAATVGAGVVEADPLLDADADYAPLPGSPAIDAGDNASVPADVSTDLLGQARFRDDPDTPDTGQGSAPLVDLGAIEFQPDEAAVHDRIFANHFQWID